MQIFFSHYVEMFCPDYFQTLSTEVCDGQPAIGPTSGSCAYLKRYSVSSSRQGLSISRSVFIILIFGLNPLPFQTACSSKEYSCS